MEDLTRHILVSHGSNLMKQPPCFTLHLRSSYGVVDTLLEHLDRRLAYASFVTHYLTKLASHDMFDVTAHKVNAFTKTRLHTRFRPRATFETYRVDRFSVNATARLIVMTFVLVFNRPSKIT